MSLVLLPTRGVVKDFHQAACAIDMLDYDLDELIRISLDALLYQDWYPASFDQSVSIESGDCRPRYPQEQIVQFNRILAMLYHRLYNALVTSGLFAEHGVLHHTNFCVYDHDIVVSDEPIPGNLGERQW